MVLILFEMIEVPLVLCFSDFKISEGLYNFSKFITAFFFLDIILTFRTGYYSKGKLILNNNKICKNYLSKWFWIDLLSTIPYDVILQSEENANSNIILLVKLTRIFRV